MAKRKSGPPVDVNAGSPGQVTPSQGSRSGNIGNVTEGTGKTTTKSGAGTGKPPSKAPTPSAPVPKAGGGTGAPVQAHPVPPPSTLGFFPLGGGLVRQPPPNGGLPVPTQQTYQQLLNSLQGTSSSTRDAYAALVTLFDSYGLGSLAPRIKDFLTQGFSADTITVLLQETPEYQKRFAGNTARLKNGLPVLTPAEYLSTEESYRQILQTSGIDPSAMTESQYSEWIGKDISPNEIQSRVNLATSAVVNAPQQLLQSFSQMGIHVGDLASYFLNDTRPMPQLQQKLNQAQIMEAGLTSGATVGMNAAQTASQAQQFAGMGITQTQAQSGYQKVGEALPTAEQLSNIYGSQAPVNENTLAQAFVGNSGTAQLAVERLGTQEEAAFQGAGGVGQYSFAQHALGNISM